MSTGDLVAHEDDGWVAPAGFNFTRDVVEYYATDPRRTALTFVDGDGVIERRTFAQVAADAARWAHVLRGSGYQPGDRVLVLLGNVPESTGILLGAIKGGLVTVPCPAPMPAREVAFRARQTGASLLIADRSAEADVDEVRSRLDAELDVLFLDEAESLLKRCRPVAPTEVTAPDHYPFVLHTSGVTKEPKGVAHTHAATYAARWQAKHWLDVGSRDIVWCDRRQLVGALDLERARLLVVRCGDRDALRRLRPCGTARPARVPRRLDPGSDREGVPSDGRARPARSTAAVTPAPRCLGRRAAEPGRRGAVSRGLRDRRLRRLRPGGERAAARGRPVTHAAARVAGCPCPRASRRRDRRGRPRDAAGRGR